MNMENTKLTSAQLIEKINATLKEKNLQLSDSDMFIYCNWYTGNHWVALTDLAKKAA